MLLFLAQSIFKIFGLIAKLCAYLLVKIGLWVPVIFVFCAVIFCAVSGIALDETALDIILAGIIITSALSIWITALLNKSVRDANKKKQTQKSSKSKIKKGKKSDFISQSQDLEFEQEFVRAKKTQIMPHIDEGSNQTLQQQPYQYNQNMADGRNTYNPQWGAQNGNIYPPQQMPQQMPQGGYMQNPQVLNPSGYGYPQQAQNINQAAFFPQGNEPHGALYSQPLQGQMPLQTQQGQMQVQQQMQQLQNQSQLPQQGQIQYPQGQVQQNSNENIQNDNVQGGYGECGSACQNGYGTRPQNASVAAARENNYQKNNATNSGMYAGQNTQIPQSVYNYEQQKRNQGFYDKYLPSYETRKANSGKPAFDGNQSFSVNNIAANTANNNFTNSGSYSDSGSYSGESGATSAAEPQQNINSRLLDNAGREEKPIVFATRKDPNIFIAEYSDRLEFYRKTKNGMKFLSTEYKTKN